jgi:hypothetical protein
VSLALHGTHLFNFVQDGEMNMTLQDPILLGTYDVSEEGIVEFVPNQTSFKTGVLPCICEETRTDN